MAPLKGQYHAIDIMTKITSEDYQNAKNYPRMFSPEDDEDKDGVKRFQVSLS